MRTIQSRRNQYVNKKVQGTLARQLIKHWLLFFSVGCLITSLYQFLLNPFQSFGEVMQQFWLQQGPFLVVALLLLPVFVLDSIKLSHRVVGPLVRVRCALQSLAKGEPVSPLTFRPEDFWHDLADEFNTAISRLQGATGTSDASSDCRPTDVAPCTLDEPVAST